MSAALRACPMPPIRPNRAGSRGWCKWCDTEVIDPRTGKPHRQRLWHPACSNEWELFNRVEAQRAFLIGRDGEACRSCGVVAPMRWLPGRVDRRLITQSNAAMMRRVHDDAAWVDEFWEWPEKVGFADFAKDEPLHPLGLWQEVERVTALQVDHVVPLWSIERTADWAFDRRWWAPANLQLLCLDCHKAKCAAEARERAKIKRGLTLIPAASR